MIAIETSITAASVPGNSIAGVARPPLKPRPRIHSVQAASGSAGHANHGRFLSSTTGSAGAFGDSGPNQSVHACASHHVANSDGDPSASETGHAAASGSATATATASVV